MTGYQDQELVWVLVLLHEKVVVVLGSGLDVDTPRKVSTAPEGNVFLEQGFELIGGQGYGVLSDTSENMPLKGFRPPFGATIAPPSPVSFIDRLPAVGLC